MRRQLHTQHVADDQAHAAGGQAYDPIAGLAVDFVVESDRAQLGEIVQRVRDGRLRTNIGNVATLDEAVAALNSTQPRWSSRLSRVDCES